MDPKCDLLVSSRVSASNATRKSKDAPKFEVVVSMCDYSGDWIAVVSSMNGSCLIHFFLLSPTPYRSHPLDGESVKTVQYCRSRARLPPAGGNI